MRSGETTYLLFLLPFRPPHAGGGRRNKCQSTDHDTAFVHLDLMPCTTLLMVSLLSIFDTSPPSVFFFLVLIRSGKISLPWTIPATHKLEAKPTHINSCYYEPP